MSQLTLSALVQAARDWDAHAATHPDDAQARLRQPGYFLYDRWAGNPFRPIRILLAGAQGVPLEQKGGRSLNMATFDAPLAALGFARVDEESPFFSPIFEEWRDQCLDTGKPLASYIGSDPRTGRIFYVSPAPMVAT